MKNKICVVTGANSGVGFATASSLARLGADVVLVCRNQKKGAAALDCIAKEVPSSRLYLAIADLSRLEQVRQLGSRLASDFPEIHLLVNNAGIYCAKLQRTEDGFEQTFAVNYLSHFLLTHLLLSPLLSAAGRVVNVSSEAHRHAKLGRASLEDNIRGRGPFSGFRAYSGSKLANILFTTELARRHPANQLSAVALHPGVLATRLWNKDTNFVSLLMRLFKPFMSRPSVGGDAVVYLAQESGEKVHGKYYEKEEPSVPAPLAQDGKLVKDMWSLSRKLVGLSEKGHEAN